MDRSTSFAGIRDELHAHVSGRRPEDLALDEAFWSQVAAQFAKSRDFIHLEYGYYHPECHAVLEVEIETLRRGQWRGAHYKRNEMRADYDAARAELAELAGSDPGEVIITRNATEALNIVIRGLPLRRGDEIVVSNLDYGSMSEAWEQRARDDGVELRRVDIPLDPASDDEVIARFSAAVTARTRVLHITHLIHFTGQVLPVKKLCALGRRHGLWIIVDAAHSFAQLPFTPAEIDCDFLAASLHKWLAAPLGLGLLYVRRDRIRDLQPLFGDTRFAAEDIRKLEHFGNRPDSPHQGLREAIRWHRAIGGSESKRARLCLLQRRWSERARALPRVQLLTPRDPERHGALGTLRIEGMSAATVVDRLFREHAIFVAAMPAPGWEGVRITPGMATSLVEIDRLSEALEGLI